MSTDSATPGSATPGSTAPDDLQEQLIKAAARIVFAVIVGILVVAYSFWPSKAAMAKKLLMRERRSVVKYKGAASQAQVQRALECAIRAPNHFLNEPWRFRILGKQTIAKIVALNDAKKEAFAGVPGWLMVTLVPTAGEEKWQTKSLEDHAACACAIQNFMLALASEGIGSKWMTGAMGSPPSALMAACDVDDTKEHFMGIVFFGRPATALADMPIPTRKIGLSAPVLTTLP